MIKEEFKSLFKNKLLILVLVAIVLIPSIYAGLFLNSMWDPYGDLEYLPVAVVNNDKPVEYKGKTLNIGEELAENLSENDTMAFSTVTKEIAEDGLKKGTYYMVITIPEDFSANASTVMDENPKQMVLDFATNPGMNYISMKLGESAMKEIKSNIMEKVTKTYTEAVFDSIGEVGDGFDKAVDGTNEMLDGEDKLIDGNTTISENLDLLASSTITFKDGSQKLKDGIVEYTDGVKQVDDGVAALDSGVYKLATGVTDVKNGSTKVLDGLKTMQKQINASMTDESKAQIQTAVTSLPQLNDGIAQLSAGVHQLNTAVNGDPNDANNNGIDISGLSTSLTGVGGYVQTAATGLVGGEYLATGDQSKMAGAAGQIKQAYGLLAMASLDNLPSGTPVTDEMRKQYIAQAQAILLNQANPADANTAMGSVVNATTQLGSAGQILTAMSQDTSLATNVQTLKASVATLDTKTAELAGAANQLLPATAGALTKLSTGLQGVQAGLNGSGKQVGLVDGMKAIDNGLFQVQAGISGKDGLQNGVAKLGEGTEKLVNNNSKLVNGVNDLSDGAVKISDGAGKLADGSNELGEGLVTLKDGTSELNTALADGADEVKSSIATDANIDMFVTPVTTNETQITKVENNGHAMAAYMMSVGLWVGCLAFCLMYPLTEYTGKLKNGFAWWGSKAIIAYPVAAVMSAVLLVILQVTNGFKPVELGKTFLISMAAATAFMSIMYFFNILLGKVGSFMMLIFMVLQLAGSAGTYPIEISGTMAATLHKYVPFTYTVNAFRSTISGGESVVPELIVLLGITLVFTAFTIIVFEIRAKRIAEDKPIVYEWIEKKGLA